MSAFLKTQIRDRMEAKNLSINALERRPGLNRSAVRNILQGFSKNPSIEILSSVAAALDCTINDLVAPGEAGGYSEKVMGEGSAKTRESYMWDEDLYHDVIKVVSELAKEQNLNLDFGQITNLANENYKYAISKKSKHADRDFCKWLMGRLL